MSVEQTSQLIQLILNSMLMVIACSLLLVGLLSRYTAIALKLQTLNREYVNVMVGADHLTQPQLTQLKHQQTHLRQRYRSSQNGILLVYAALVSSLLNTLLLAMRTLWSQLWLIQGSFFFFAAGVALLLAGIGMTLADFHQSRRSLLQEFRSWVAPPQPNNPELRTHRLLPQKTLPPTPERSRRRIRVS
ncbi:DUF2721 domain-containing protein [Leptolyngbya sp. AN02str]|uniref:DUF2721 domain-containing protein n=1 Tax=Leptolyngbya sp. AN02str TaxID=3423363 RepID=UPI003D315D0A